MPVPNIFANATSTIPLSQLDANFATTITLGNTAIQLGNTVSTLNNMTLANVTITGVASPITVAQGGTGATSLTANNVVLGNGTSTVQVVAPGTSGNVLTSNGTTWLSSAANVTLGNTTISVGGTANTVGNLTLSNTTVTNYTETLFSATGNTTISLSNGTLQKITTSGATTITLPSSVAGKSFSVLVAYAAADTLTWAGGSTLKWSQGATPTPTSATGKFDLFSFVQDGTNTYGIVNGQNY